MRSDAGPTAASARSARPIARGAPKRTASACSSHASACASGGNASAAAERQGITAGPSMCIGGEEAADRQQVVERAVGLAAREPQRPRA